MTKEDDYRILKKEPVFVTAFSDNHFDAAVGSVPGTFSKVYPSKKLIVYDLGLNERRIKQLRNTPCVSGIRQFNLSAYPDYVRNLFGYRWKPLLLAELLQEFEAVFYADAHVVFKNEANMDDLLATARCHTDGCANYNYLLPWITDHSIYATTDKRTFEYLPMNDTMTKKVHMGDAGFQLIYYTKDVRSHVYKWLILCALEEGCMAPKGTTIPCSFDPNDRFNVFANCHRYDQTVSSILLANRNSYSLKRYTYGFAHTRS